ncbi:MAG: glutamate-cysteine ligase family protein, partial [Planctomycetota bacterium]
MESELGYCTLEVSLAPQATLFDAERRLRSLLDELNEVLDPSGHRLLGYGIQPLTPPSRALVAPKSRFLIYDRRYQSNFLNPSVGTDIHTFTVAAANQCHIDIAFDEAMAAVNTLGALAGVQLALTANSPVWRGEIDGRHQAVRETFYDILYDFHGDSIDRPFGILPEFGTLAEYIRFLLRFEPLMVLRHGHYVEVLGDSSIGDLLSAVGPIPGRTLAGDTVPIEPDRDGDLLSLANRLESNVRLSPQYGTLESRISCQQPPGEILVVPALILGLLENLPEAEALVGTWPRATWQASRLGAACLGLNARIAGQPITEIA